MIAQIHKTTDKVIRPFLLIAFALNPAYKIGRYSPKIRNAGILVRTTQNESNINNQISLIFNFLSLIILK